jgi:hypothetical protein
MNTSKAAAFRLMWQFAMKRISQSQKRGESLGES